METLKKRKVYINKKKNSKAEDMKYEETGEVEKELKNSSEKEENKKEEINTEKVVVQQDIEQNDVGEPKKYNIPAHILGRSLTDPMNDTTSGNRRLQKPRPGVKIPYRNLTSQIISNEELNREVLIRSNKRNYPYKNDPPTELQCKLYAQDMKTRLLNKGNNIALRKYLNCYSLSHETDKKFSERIIERLPKLKNIKLQSDCLGILRMACEVKGETKKAIEELEQIPIKRHSAKATNNITLNVDYKKINLEQPISAQEIALRQLAEMDSDKVKRGRKRKV